MRPKSGAAWLNALYAGQKLSKKRQWPPQFYPQSLTALPHLSLPMPQCLSPMDQTL
jgi:hypothetical protein